MPIYRSQSTLSLETFFHRIQQWRDWCFPYYSIWGKIMPTADAPLDNSLVIRLLSYSSRLHKYSATLRKTSGIVSNQLIPKHSHVSLFPCQTRRTVPVVYTILRNAIRDVGSLKFGMITETYHSFQPIKC